MVKTIKEISKTEIVDDTVNCDGCGAVMKEAFDQSYISGVSLCWDFGYASSHDTECWEIDLCDPCFEKILAPNARKVRN